MVNECEWKQWTWIDLSRSWQFYHSHLLFPAPFSYCHLPSLGWILVRLAFTMTRIEREKEDAHYRTVICERDIDLFLFIHINSLHVSYLSFHSFSGGGPRAPKRHHSSLSVELTSGLHPLTIYLSLSWLRLVFASLSSPAEVDPLFVFYAAHITMWVCSVLRLHSGDRPRAPDRTSLWCELKRNAKKRNKMYNKKEERNPSTTGWGNENVI